MAYMIHGARRGKIVQDNRVSQKQAAVTATRRAANGYQVTVFDGNKVVMVCGPGKKASKNRKHWCRITDRGFKPPGKLNLKRGG